MTEFKSFLFLQGPPNGYWSRLGQGLESSGHPVRKIDLCLADSLFWRGSKADAYRGKFANWHKWLEKYVIKHGITDIIYYADQHPYHIVARDLAQQYGIKCWAVEFGYLRPDWLTLERNGMGPLSCFPRTKPEIELLGAKYLAPDMACRFPHKFIHEALGEVVFHLLQTFGRPLYPFFKSDKTYWPVVDYLAWLPEFLRGKKQKSATQVVEKQFLSGKHPFWLVGLQIHADYQIRSHSRFDHQEEMLAEIFQSFSARNIAGDLVIKTHPLDNGLENWPKKVARQAEKYRLTGRVHLIKGGDLGRFFKHTNGVIIANSTVGLHSVAAGVPTLNMAKALYDIAGLTHQSGLDEFWQNPEIPDVEFAKTYRRALMDIQIKGSFYNRLGQKVAVAQMVKRLSKTENPAKLPLQFDHEPIIVAAE